MESKGFTLALVCLAAVFCQIEASGAERPKGFGMTAELQDKKDSKYNEAMAHEVLQWIRRYIPDVSDTSGDAEHFYSVLKSGVVLDKLANALVPGSINKINEGKMAFKQMENIGNFLTFAEKYGVSKTDLFQTVDLYERTNLPQVVTAIHALGRKAASKGKPGIGPKEAASNPRKFTEGQLRAGEGVIGLQMGTYKFSNQAGQNFGKTRLVID